MRLQIQRHVSNDFGEQGASAPAATGRFDPAASIVHFHRAIGNHAFGRLIQAKLKVNQPGDEYEREADRVAERMIKMPEAQRISSSLPSMVQRKCADEDKTVRRKSSDSGAALFHAELMPLNGNALGVAGTSILPEQNVEVRDIQSQLGEGRPLDGHAGGRMATAFGHDFSKVRIHTDAKAAQLSSGLDARAFTVGSHVAFADSEYQPGTLVGDALIAHELAHVVQQGRGHSSSDFDSGNGENADGALESDANQAVAGIIAPALRTGDGNSSRPQRATSLRLQRCGASRPPLRSPRDLLQESSSFEQQALAELGQREGRMRGQGQDRNLALASVAITGDIQNVLRWLSQIYEEEMQDAGSDPDRRLQAQQRFVDQMQRLREAFTLQFELTARYGIQFTTGRERIDFQARPPRERFRVVAWSREELQRVDAILRRLPHEALSRIQTIQREPGEASGNPASWEETTSTLRIQNIFFERSEEEMTQYLIHEIGHSTVTERTEGEFPHLPPQDWMSLSDWRTSTRSRLGDSLGLQGEPLRRALERLDENAGRHGNFPQPIRIGNRMVIHDKYESRYPPSRFFHYAVAHHDEFVSNYARTHPAEDFAESFAFFTLRAEPTQRILDVGARGIMDKWDYLVQHLGRLRRGGSAAPASRESAQSQSREMAE